MPKFTQTSKRERIIELIKRLEDGDTVQARDVDLVLTTRQQAELRSDWKEQLELRKIEKPSSVIRYEKKLQEALMWYGRYEQFRTKKTKGNGTALERFARREALGRKQESLFEDALEILQETVSEDENLRTWFDRDIDFSFGSNLGIDPISMPRVLSSRSLDNLAGKDWKQNFGVKTKIEHKIDCLRRALIELDNKPPTTDATEVDAAEQLATLKGVLAKIRAVSGN